MATKIKKGGAYIIQQAEPKEIFIPEEFNEEQKMISDMATDFLASEVLPNLDRIDAQEEGLMEKLLEKAGELGLLATSIPEQYEGFGKDFNTSLLLTEIIGGGHSFAVALAAHTGIGTLPIVYFGNEEQKKKYLRKLANGALKAS
ncbi:MAG: acyl-CoA dehydrogenase family protein, partial [Cytophagaceae bacterium]